MSILLRFVSVRCRPNAVRGVPLSAGAGLQACRGHCGSGRVTVWGRTAFGPSGAPLRLPRPSQGGEASPGLAEGVQGRRPLGRPPAFCGLGGGRGQRGGGELCQSSPLLPWFFSLAASPSLQRARPGLRGVPGCRARPGGSAAGGSVRAVRLAHVPCGRRGVGALCVPPSLGGLAAGPWGARGGGSLCLCPSLCLPWAGTKAGFIGVPFQTFFGYFFQKLLKTSS